MYRWEWPASGEGAHWGAVHGTGLSPAFANTTTAMTGNSDVGKRLARRLGAFSPPSGRRANPAIFDADTRQVNDPDGDLWDMWDTLYRARRAEMLRKAAPQAVAISRFFASMHEPRRVSTQNVQKLSVTGSKYDEQGWTAPNDRTAEQQRFLSLFLRSEKEVFRYVAALVPNMVDAEDIVQQTALAQGNSSFDW